MFTSSRSINIAYRLHFTASRLQWKLHYLFAYSTLHSFLSLPKVDHYAYRPCPLHFLHCAWEVYSTTRSQTMHLASYSPSPKKRNQNKLLRLARSSPTPFAANSEAICSLISFTLQTWSYQNFLRLLSQASSAHANGLHETRLAQKEQKWLARTFAPTPPPAADMYAHSPLFLYNPQPVYYF